MLLAVSSTVFPIRVQAATTVLKLDPSSVVDETLTPGNTFGIAVQVEDVQNLYAYEFKIYFNNTVLNATNAIRPTGNFLEPSDPANQFIPKWEIKNNFNATNGRIWLSITLLAPETARSGNGVLVEINFTILNIGSTALTFGDTLLADDTGGSIVHEDGNGFFSNSPAPPPPPPPVPAYVYVNPPDITDAKLTPSSNFTVQVDILNASDVYSFELKLDFNPAILGALELQEGSFLKNSNLTLSTISINNTEGFVTLNSALTSVPTISGDGNIVTINFTVLSTGSTALTISEFVAQNSTREVLNVTVANGHFSNMALEGDVNGDGSVNFNDLVAAAVAFGSTPDSPKWNLNADVNSDGIVNVIDLVIVMMNFGSVIPEYPSFPFLLIFIIATIALALSILRKKRAKPFKT